MRDQRFCGGERGGWLVRVWFMCVWNVLTPAIDTQWFEWKCSKNQCRPIVGLHVRRRRKVPGVSNGASQALDASAYRHRKWTHILGVGETKTIIPQRPFMIDYRFTTEIIFQTDCCILIGYILGSPQQKAFFTFETETMTRLKMSEMSHFWPIISDLLINIWENWKSGSVQFCA